MNKTKAKMGDIIVFICPNKVREFGMREFVVDKPSQKIVADNEDEVGGNEVWFRLSYGSDHWGHATPESYRIMN